MKLILDAMGGDNAPLEILKGAAQAVAEYPDIELILTGRETELRELSGRENISLERISFIDTPEVVTMEDPAQSVVMSKKNSSMAVGLKTLAAGDGGSAESDRAGESGADCRHLRPRPQRGCAAGGGDDYGAPPRRGGEKAGREAFRRLAASALHRHGLDPAAEDPVPRRADPRPRCAGAAGVVDSH